MVILRIPVECVYCKKQIDKRTALFVKNLQNKNLYQCSICFGNNSRTIESKDIKTISLYCEKCKYKFTSKKAICPYCNRFDTVMKTDIKISDLIE
ncbi:MAG TPA: hypothetical protein VJI98_05325 [Candidatus Nanoarchaeia archaeon]|nr:hypothetical protein [Candidatus Nanoarchaeia archaeon]